MRSFLITEGLSRCFEVIVGALSPRPDLDLEQLVGRAASFQLTSGLGPDGSLTVRRWTGVCNQAQLIHAEPTGHSSYRISIVPQLWLLSQRRGQRIFQHLTLPEIVTKLLGEWGIEHDCELVDSYPKHELTVQYDESDLDFVSRLLEEAGVTFAFDFAGGAEGKLRLTDDPHGAAPFRTLPHVEHPERELGVEYLTKVKLRHEVRPGRLAIRDHDFRRPLDTQLGAAATPAKAPEDFLEQYRYQPGAFRVVVDGARTEPVADDRAVVRHDEAGHGRPLAERSLQALRRAREQVRFEDNCLGLWPGRVFAVGDYPHPELDPGGEGKLLCTETWLEGTSEGEWSFGGEATLCQRPYRPEPRTPRPRILGVQSAVVVGPAGQEIHCDEHGRVRVQLHWDRDGKYDQGSSCWIRVSQAWAGPSYGSVMLPRIGQEVLVGFLDGDPDQPLVVGRLYNATAKVPYALPAHKTRSSWKSDSSPGAVGFNELMLDDAKGRELFFVQAQKNLQKLVKSHEAERTGKNRSLVVGGDRSEVVGQVDATLTGKKVLVQAVAPPPEDDLKIQGQGETKLTLRPTAFEMIDRRLILTTGQATIALDGSNVRLEAEGDISFKAKGGDVVIRGSRVLVNTLPAPPAPKIEVYEPHQPKTVPVHAPHDRPALKAKPEERSVRAPGAAPPAAPQQPAPTVRCVFKEATIHCQHDGRKPNDAGVLEVVPAEVGDTITLAAKAAPSCGKHPSWSLSGPFGHDQVAAASTTMKARPWNVVEPTATLVLRWLSGVAPKQYSAWARACTGESQRYLVKAYPKDEINVSWTPKEFEPAKKVLELVNGALKAYFPKAELKGLVGVGVKIAAQWTEWEDWRAYYKFTANVGFNPLFALTLRLPFGPTAAIPAWVKKWVGDITFFVEFFGSIAVGLEFGRDRPGPPRLSGKLEGEVGGRLGGLVKAGKVVEVECAGTTSIRGTAQPRYSDAEGPYADLEVAWTGLKASITVSIWNGKIEKQYSLQIIDERTIKKGTWHLLRNKA